MKPFATFPIIERIFHRDQLSAAHENVKSQKDNVKLQGLASGCGKWQAGHMFTIEHEFDATVITLMDEAPAPLTEDITINSFTECVTVEQYDPRTDTVQTITLSPVQLRDLAVALDLPEGVYQLRDDAE